MCRLMILPKSGSPGSSRCVAAAASRTTIITYSRYGRLTARSTCCTTSSEHGRIKAVWAASSEREGDDAGRRECTWQREQLPDEIRELVLDDQRLRNELCWFAFDCRLRSPRRPSPPRRSCRLDAQFVGLGSIPHNA
jgi:hypothetical protein